jgi:hypothetical protein
MYLRVDKRDHGYDVSASVIAKNAPADVLLRATVSEEGAVCFRDINKYTTYKAVGDAVYVEYPDGIGPYRRTTKLILRAGKWGNVSFESPSGEAIRVRGEFTFDAAPNGNGRVTLCQRVEPTGIFAWLPIRKALATRVQRAMEDYSKIDACLVDQLSQKGSFPFGRMCRIPKPFQK